jgi:hypothetical protein
MRATAFAANTSASSFSKQFHRALLLSALIVTASLNSWAQNITVSPASLTFAKQIVGTTSSSKAVTISNSGASAQPIVIVMSGDYTETDTCSGSVPGSGSCTAKISFTPTLVGSIKGAASIYDNSKNLLAFVGITGTGEAPVTTAPTSLSFTGGTIGTKSAAKTFKITNNTTGTVTINSITTNVTDYTITTGTCLTTPLAKAGSCTVTVTVTPTSAVDDGAIIITDNAPNGLPLAVKLTSAATGGTTTPISLSKTSLTFKAVTGGISATQTITVKNSSASAVTMRTISASSDYAIVSNSCPGSLAAAGTCTFGITFDPRFVGAIEGAASVAYTGNNSPQLVNLAGISLAPLTVAPASLTFTAQAVGTTSAAKAVKITNNNRSAVTLSSVVPSGDFQIQASGTTCSTSSPLAAGKVCTIEIQFAPTIAGSIVGSLTVANTASPNPLLVPFSGTVTAPAIVITSANSATFTKGTVGSFTVTATGTPTPGITESGALPTGVTFSAGVLSGTPTQIGTWAIVFTASNGVSPNATQNFTLTVTAAPQAPVITSANSATFTKGTVGSFTVTATGTPTPSITESGALPGGVTFNAGILSGTPTASGTFPITFTASNGVLPNATQNFTLTIGPSLVSIQVTPAYPSVTVGHTQQFRATGTFSDGSTKNLTSTVTWSSSSAPAATVNTSGLATAAAVGTTTIKAASGTMNGSTSLIVTSATTGSDAAAAVTDSNGMATLISNGLTVPVQLADQDTGATLAGVAVALGTDPSVPGSATLIIADPTGVHPPQVVLFEGPPVTPAETGQVPLGVTRHGRMGKAQQSVSGAAQANASCSTTAVVTASTGCPAGSGTTASQAITLCKLPAPPSPISITGAQTQIIDAVNALQSLDPKSIPAGMYGPISVTQYSPTIASDCVQDVENVLAEHVNAKNVAVLVLEQVPQFQLAGKLVDLYGLWSTRGETISAFNSCYYQTGQPQTINISQVCFGASCIFIPQIAPLPNPGPGLVVAASVIPMVNSLMTFESDTDIGLTVLGTTDSTGTGEVGVPEGANTVCVDSSGYQQFTEPGFIVSAPGTPLDVTLTPQGQAQTYSGSYTAPFNGTASDPLGGVYSASASFGFTVSLTQNSDGSITGSASVPANINISVVSCPSGDSCSADSFTATATGSVTGTNVNISANLSSGGTDPLLINFIGTITGNSIAVTGGFSTTFEGQGGGLPPTFTTLNGTITGLTLPEQ